MKNILMYSHELAGYEYRADHPFKPVRAKIFMELLHRYGLIGDTNQMVVEPVPIEERLLTLFHRQGYIELLKRVDRMEFDTEMLSAGLGTEDNPIFRRCLDSSLLQQAQPIRVQ
jgi:acetoin utilization deacetylase AcuC-like enzyme